MSPASFAGSNDRPDGAAAGPAIGPAIGPAVGTVIGSDGEAMALALGEAVRAEHHDDVPVGAVVVRDGIVIAARHNERELTNDPTAHAEVLAIRDAAAFIGNWHLDECTLYVTLEPCAMCAGGLVNARMARVVFGASDPKAGAGGSLFNLLAEPRLNHRCRVDAGLMSDECGALLRAFFAARRRANAGAASAAADAGDQTT
jgi:tRNA(adenine34) deaminase